jgi:hypothetical protein
MQINGNCDGQIHRSVRTAVSWVGVRGGLRVCGAQIQCSERGPRALKNVVGCGCVLDALLFM